MEGATVLNDGMPADLGVSDRGHEVQYYEHSRFLVGRVADFVAPGLEAGEGAVVIATPKHADLIIAELLARGVDVDSAAAALTTIRMGDLPLRVLTFSRAPAFPTSVLQLGSFAAVVVDQFDLSALSQPQMNALRDYVGLGGSLVLVGGTSWRRTLLPVPPELSPLRPTATVSQSLQPVAMLGGGESAPTAPVAMGDLARQARVVVAGDVAPLMVELAYGAGRVVTLAFDPAADPVLGLRLAAASWSEALGRAVLKARASSGWASSAIPAPSVAVASSLAPPPEAPLPPPWSLALGLLAYMLLIGPVNLVLSRRLGRPDLLWVTIPVLAVVSVGGLYVAGGILHRDSHDQQLQVLRVGPQGTVSSVEYHEILFTQRGQHQIESSSNALLAPMTLGIHQAATADCPRCAQQLGGLPQDVAEHAVAGSRPTVVESGVAYGNVRVVSVATAGHYPLGLDAHLSVAQGRIQGRIKNLSDSPVGNLALYSFDGESFRRTDLVASLGPGEQVEIDAEPTAMDVTPPAARAGGQSGAGHLADTIARAALAADPQPILLGLVQPLKSHLRLDGIAIPRGGSAVLVQPVRMESADTMLRSWQQVHLLGTAGDPRSGAQAVQSVYDIDVPAAHGLPLTLAFDSGQHAPASVEVYDWRQRTWRSGPWTVDPHNPLRRQGDLGPDEVSGGTVRIRVKENRLTWGSYLQVEASASSG